LFKRFPIGANIVLLPEVASFIVLLIINQQYNHKNNFIKYAIATFLSTMLFVFIALIYIVYMFHYASFP
jgi:RsiW-degrading membrane proteinase PrsW (M82 family)